MRYGRQQVQINQQGLQELISAAFGLAVIVIPGTMLWSYTTHPDRAVEAANNRGYVRSEESRNAIENCVRNFRNRGQMEWSGVLGRTTAREYCTINDRTDW